MDNPHREAVSLVIKNDSGEFLAVKRPISPDDELGGLWGFPAVNRRDDESELDAAQRVATQKLGVKVSIGQRIGESTHQRPGYVLHLVDYEATIIEGIPTVPQPDASVTQYTGCRFSNDPTILYAIARKGSQCTQIYLESIGADWSS